MRKIIFVGRSEAGKTSLTQAMRGETVTYHKTQYVNCYDVIIDTPGEYAETARVAHALATYSYEADIVGLLISAIEPYSLYPPCITVLANREVVGIVTKIDHRLANPHRAAEWLKLAGCRKIFYISSYTGEGIPELLEYLKEEGDVLPWEKAKEMQDAFNREHGIVPKTIVKPVHEILEISEPEEHGRKRRVKLSAKERLAEIAKLEKQMKEASKMLEFEYAAVLRDRIIELRGEK